MKKSQKDFLAAHRQSLSAKPYFIRIHEPPPPRGPGPTSSVHSCELFFSEKVTLFLLIILQGVNLYVLTRRTGAQTAHTQKWDGLRATALHTRHLLSRYSREMCTHTNP